MEAVKYRNKAAQLLEYALQNGDSRTGFHLLEPILIMFTLDVGSLSLYKHVVYHGDSINVVHTLRSWNLVDALNSRAFDPASLRRSQRVEEFSREVSSRHVSLVSPFCLPYPLSLFKCP